MIKYNYMENNMEDLIGPRSDERGERVIEGVDSNGVPLWMAFLNDPESPTISADEIQDAKNAYEKMKAEKPEVIKMCERKTYDECRGLINPAEAA